MSPSRWVAAVVAGMAVVLGLTFFVAVAGEPGDDSTPASCAQGRAKGLEKEHPGQGRGLDKEHPGQGKGLDKDHPGKGRGLDKDHPGKGRGLDKAPGRSGDRGRCS